MTSFVGHADHVADSSDSRESLSNAEELAHEFEHVLRYSQGVTVSRATDHDLYQALGQAVRRRMMDKWVARIQAHRQSTAKVVVYLSAEYLLGPQLPNALSNLGIEDEWRAALRTLGIDLNELLAVEHEPGTGNGGLGRLAACYLDSMATMSIPAVGYGIRYEFGIFTQAFVDNRQVELPDKWLSMGNPWEFPHHHMTQEIGFGGTTETSVDDQGVPRVSWLPERTVIAKPYNYLIPGYRNEVVNSLRLWSALSPDEFNLAIFNAGDYELAVAEQVRAENLSKVLYPEDSTPQGKELRLSQQYFFTAASIRDFLEQGLQPETAVQDLPERVTFQLNDTHPVIGIPELMRILVDEYELEWDTAWDIARRCFAYTCHTLMPEALEIWPVEMLQRLLPRHMEIIYRINADLLREVTQAFPEDQDAPRRMSIIQEEPFRGVRMAHLAVYGSAKVNGVAELHSQLLRDRVLVDFSAMTPEKFTNVTNGVTPRRFMLQANPSLSQLITEAIGPGWVTDLDRLRELEAFADDASFLEDFAEVKRANKVRLAQALVAREGVDVDPSSMFDVMVKRLHEYKRQILKLLHIITVYQRIKDDPSCDFQPRTFVFGAKAAPGYLMAKYTIAAILGVGETIRTDPIVRGKINVAFPANYNVILNEIIVPAAELSEQISMAGKEASGTSNMKFALNGALTIGTLDGANVEIRELVGPENFFLFGLTESEATALVSNGYRPQDYYLDDDELRRAVDALASGELTGGDTSHVAPLVSHLIDKDPFCVFADFRSYVDAQDEVQTAYGDAKSWNSMAVRNIARSGFFSSDRSIRDYLDRIWHARPMR